MVINHLLNGMILQVESTQMGPLVLIGSLGLVLGELTFKNKGHWGRVSYDSWSKNIIYWLVGLNHPYQKHSSQMRIRPQGTNYDKTWFCDRIPGGPRADRYKWSEITPYKIL